MSVCRVTFRLSPELLGLLKEECAEQRITLSAHLRKIANASITPGKNRQQWR
jgi:hypothetical protein